MGYAGHETNWYVITGAPSSGKTSVIRELEKLGYRVVHEVARTYIEEELKKGRNLVDIKADALAFEQQILNRKIDIEASLPRGAVIFFDRAIPDSIAYFMLEKLDPAVPLRQSQMIRYKRVFFFERLVFEKDSVRSEDESSAARLEILLEACYRQLGYQLVKVPLIPLRARTQFVLKHLSSV
jgi:predicted ATPase